MFGIDMEAGDVNTLKKSSNFKFKLQIDKKREKKSFILYCDSFGKI